MVLNWFKSGYASHGDNRVPVDKLTCKRGAHQHGQTYMSVVILCCGSFNPPTNAHLRMFELAAQELRKVLLYGLFMERKISVSAFVKRPRAASPSTWIMRQGSPSSRGHTIWLQLPPGLEVLLYCRQVTMYWGATCHQ
jgi:hypothetical protein